MKTILKFYLATIFFLKASSAYNADYNKAQQQIHNNIPTVTINKEEEEEERRQQQQQMIDLSESRPILSPNCLAHTSAVMTENIEIRQASPAKGLGVFATGTIACGTYLGEYSGECMTLNEVKARFWGKRKPDVADQAWAASRQLRNQGITGNYIMELRTAGLFVCAEDGEQSTWTRFMNHAPAHDAECNVKGFWQTETDGDYHQYPRFYAIRDIEKGEELHFDYGKLSGYE